MPKKSESNIANDLRKKVINPFINRLRREGLEELIEIRGSGRYPRPEWKRFMNALVRELVQRVIAKNADTIFPLNRPDLNDYKQVAVYIYKHYNEEDMTDDWRRFRSQTRGYVNDWWEKFGQRCVDMYNKMDDVKLGSVLNVENYINAINAEM